MEKGFELFSTKGIGPVTMQEVADASGYGVATLYRYFLSKGELVIAVAAWKWDEYLKTKLRPETDELSGAERFRSYLDSFLDLYRYHKDLLCFTQFLNIYLRSEHPGPDVIKPYRDTIRDLELRFREVYKKALSDHTLRTDIPEKIMFSTTLHLMLAAVTRYAVGLVYEPEAGYDPEPELVFLCDSIMEKYKN